MSAPVESPPTTAPAESPTPTPQPGTNGGTPPTPTPTPAAVASPFDGLPTEIRGEPAITKYKSVEELARGYLEVTKLVGAKGIIPPGKDATPEQVTAFHEALGTPKDPSNYAVAKDFQPPEGLPWNPQLLPGLLPIFKKIGITDAQATEIVGSYAKGQDEAFRSAMGEMAAAREQADVALHREWGTAYDAKMDSAQRAYKAYAGKNADEAGALVLADGTPLAEHPLMKRIFAAIGEAQGEHPLLGDANRRMTQTPDEAADALRKLENEEPTRSIILDRMHPEHSAVMARRSSLHAAKVAK